MFKRIYDILVQFLGESKQGSYDVNCIQYQFNCPLCAEHNGGIPDNKYNLEINMQKQKFLCWKDMETDNMCGNIAYLIKKYGNKELYNNYKNELIALKRIKLYDINAYSGITFETENISLKLPKTFRKINLNNCPDNRVVNYCIKRKIDQNIIDKFNIGYTTWDETDKSWANRIIVPSYDSFDDLNYYVGRDFTGKSKQKYKNCEAEKKEIVYQESHINPDSDIILVEGVFDCLYANNTIALLGKVLTRDSEIYQYLYNKANAKIIIAIDADTNIEEVKKIYNLLNVGRLKNKIWYIRLDKYKDFGEIYENNGRIGIVNTIHTAKQFNEIDLLL